MDTRRSGEAFLSLQAFSSSHFVRRKRPFSTKCVWNQQAKARFGFDAHENDDARFAQAVLGNFFGPVVAVASGVGTQPSDVKFMSQERCTATFKSF